MKYIDIHTHVNIQNQEVISISNILPGDSNPENPFSVGLHPWLISEEKIENDLEAIRLLIKSENCLAIGECGLDRPNFIKTGRNENNNNAAKQKGKALQEEVFRKQIRIANLANKPLIIHCVRAFPELLHIHKTEKNKTPWIIHGFRGSEEEAHELTRKGIFLSFGKSILYEKSSKSKITKIFSNISEDFIFLETDNVDIQERKIEDIYERASIIRNTPIEQMGKSIENNFKKVFY